MRTCLWLLASLLAVPAAAQEGGWSTIETEHYRVHHPNEAEAWARYAASQLEVARERVAPAVGNQLERKVDVMVRDPMATANGSAWPFLRHPRMILWTSPPDSGSVLANYRDPIEDLVVHEDTHLVHLMKPARGGLDKIAQSIVGVSPVATKSPRWVSEGYATVIEGRITGFGRPNADFRSSWLREMAVAGRLPEYSELDGSGRWQGMGFAYLVGSAYLEWLEERTDEHALVRLWRRMTAVEDRTFDESFEGIFGDSPQRLYGRFVAEVTRDAMAIEALRPEEEGELWMELSQSTGKPVVSPDGSQIAVLVRSAEKPSALVVYETQDDTEAAEKYTERRNEALERDPLDVIPEARALPRHKEVARRTNISRSAMDPQWTPDGQQLIFAARSRSSDGRLRTDLYSWDPESGSEKRITRGADVFAASVAPSGEWAVAIQSRWGATALVRVDLSSGEVEPLGEARVDAVVDQPRISPDGSKIAYLRSAGGPFVVVLRDVESGEETVVPTPSDLRVADPAWAPDGTLVATLGRSGFMEIGSIAEDGSVQPWTRSSGAALAPSVSDSGTWFLSLTVDGYVLRRLEAPAEFAPLDVAGVAVTRPPPPPMALDAKQVEVDTGRSYGLGRQEVRPLLGGVAGTERGGQFEFGLRVGDVVGRQEWLALGSIGDRDGVDGGSLAFAYRKWPIDLSVHGFVASRGLAPWMGGGLLTAERVRQGRLGLVSASVSGGLRQGLSSRTEGSEPVEMQGLAAASLGLAVREPRSGGIGFSARGTALVQGEMILGATAAATLGRQDWVTVTGSGLWSDGGPVRVGGTRAGVLPEELQWDQLIEPALDGQTAQGTEVYRGNVRLGAPAGVDATWIEVPGELDAERYVLAGVRGEISMGGEPLLKVPAFDVTGGLQCLVVDPDRTEGKPCQELSHYRLWAGVTWGVR